MGEAADVSAETFAFRVTGVEDNEPSRRNYDVPVDEVFEIVAESVGDALNELVNRSAMWETVDSERGFTIAYEPREDTDA